MSLRVMLWKDARNEMRRKEGVTAGSVLVLLFLVVDMLIFPDLAGEPRAATAVLWTPLIFATAALLGRGFAAEHEQGSLEWLRSAPVSPLAIGASRTLIDGALTLWVAVLAWGGAGLLFGIAAGPALALVGLLAVLGLAVVGTLAGALATQAEARALLLPILLVPALAPLLIAGVDATLIALAGGTIADARPALLLMAGYDVLAIGVAWLLWPVVLEGD